MTATRQALFGGSRWVAPAAALMVTSAILASAPNQPAWARVLSIGSAVAVWVGLIVWLGRSTLRADDRAAHLRVHWLAVLGIVVPPLLPVVLIVDVWPRLNARGWLVGFVSLATTVILTGAVAVLHLERNADDSTITSLGDAVWWAMVTSTTVGYGDEVPVTSGGRAVASLMLFAGVAIVSAGTAALASGLVRTDRSEEPTNTDLAEAIAELRAEVRTLTGPAGGDDGGVSRG